MGSKGNVVASTYVVAILLCLNMLSFTIVSSQASMAPTPSQNTKCSMNPLNLGVCANVLNLVNVIVGSQSTCCSLIEGMLDIEAAVCLCTAIKANVLGLNLNIPVSISSILNSCGKNNAAGYQCS